MDSKYRDASLLDGVINFNSVKETFIRMKIAVSIRCRRLSMIDRSSVFTGLWLKTLY